MLKTDLVDQLLKLKRKAVGASPSFARRILEKKAAPKPVIAKDSQETLAEMIGTTRSRVSFFMNNIPAIGVHQL